MAQEESTNQKNPRLSQEALDLMLLLLAVNPTIYPKQIRAILEDRFDESPTDKQIRHQKEKHQDRIKELRENSKLTVELGLELGLIGKYSSKLSRIAALEKVIDQGIDGAYEEVQSARGEVLSLKKMNLPAALSALKQLREEFGEDVSEEEFTVNINLATPPPEDDEDDEEDE